jgi:energy-coupling factor transport system permease protein
MTALATPRTRSHHALGNRAPARWLHPGAWWLWALGLAAAASRTSNPLALGLLIGAAAIVVRARRPDAPWARSFALFLVLGAVVVAIRVVTQMIFGTGASGALLFTLPEIELPAFFAGVSLGGPVYAGDLVVGFVEGLRLATMLICLGAAASLASPSRMLKAVPAALYELGVAVVVALTVAPQVVTDLLRVRSAQRLRGRRVRGLRGWWSAALPVINGSLERSIQLAAAMDSRGYGRTAQVPAPVRFATQAVLLLGVGGIILGLYGSLSGGQAAAFGPPVVVVGASVAAVGLALAGRRQIRTRYRPDPWGLPEWLVASCGVVTASTFVALAAQPGAVLTMPVAPLALPALPIAAAVIGLVATGPALLAPPVPEAVRR